VAYFLSRIAFAHCSISDGERQITSRQLGLWNNKNAAIIAALKEMPEGGIPSGVLTLSFV